MLKTMSVALAVLFFVLLLLLLLHSHVSLASDSDPVNDFCIPNTNNSATCKNSTLVTVEDFVFSGIKYPGNVGGTGLASIPVNVNVFPGLNTLGMSFVRADFEVGGFNVPHFHPRATEIAFVVEGRIYSGFVDTQNRIYAKVIEKGEVMVFPRGQLHFQMNAGNTRATVLGSFDSQNPGTMKIPSAVFGSGIDGTLLEKAFGLTANEIAELRKRLAPK